MDLKEQIKQLARENGIDFVGVAPVSRFVNAPEGRKPGDFLPGAESVISMGVRVSAGPQLTQRLALANKRKRHIAFSYRWFGYGVINMYFLDRASFLVSKLLDENGEIGVPIVASGVEDLRTGFAAFSNRHAAVAAGLAEFAWNGLAITPEAGVRARFVSVITTAQLDPDPMYSGPRLCDPKKCAEELGDGVPVCAKLCPLNAFDLENTVEVDYGERKYTYALMDRQKCGKAAGQGMHPKALGPDYMGAYIPEKVDYEAWLRFKEKMPPEYWLETVTYGRGNFCGVCFLRCPVGAPEMVDEIMKDIERD